MAHRARLVLLSLIIFSAQAFPQTHEVRDPDDNASSHKTPVVQSLNQKDYVLRTSHLPQPSTLPLAEESPLVPDPFNLKGFFIKGSPGHFAVRGCDLFIDDGTDFNQSVAVSTNSFTLRALRPYDMHFDPLLDGGQKLTNSGVDIDLQNSDGTPVKKPVSQTDDILFIDRAVFYDDNESDDPGGFWANWKVIVTPFGDTGDEFVLVGPTFRTKFRGPFWSGEKLEVGDTGGSFLPQVMHYENFGIWDWSWSGFNSVRVRVEEGDGGFYDDHVVTFIVKREETLAGAITIADTGDLVDLFLTDDGRFKRVVTDDSGVDGLGRPRIRTNPDNHDTDVTFRSGPMGTRSDENPSFSDRYGLGAFPLRGESELGFCDWKNPGVTLGPTLLQYIDNISYTPGWDCASFTSPFASPDDDFEFKFEPRASDVKVETDRGGCGGKTTVFLRCSEVLLPNDALVTRNLEERVRVPAGETVTVLIPRTAGYEGYGFTELLAYNTNGDDDLGFRINKSVTSSNFVFTASAFGAPSDAGIEIRATAIEWPSDGTAQTLVVSTKEAGSGAAHGAANFPIPSPQEPYFLINELLTYDPDGDDDMSWSLYFEHIQDRIDIQLASGNASEGSRYVQAEAAILQFVDLTPPKVTCPSTIVVECTSPEGNIVGFVATAEDERDPAPMLVCDPPSGSVFPVGTTTVVCTATDNAGNSATCSFEIQVVDTTPPTISVDLNRDVLWPPNHKLSQIQAAVVTNDICDPNPSVVLSYLASDEADNGRGDGNTLGDVQEASLGTEDLEFLLRSERAGRGAGRKYTIVYSAFDFSGNSASDTTYVRVPHDQREGNVFASSGFIADGSSIDETVGSYFLVIPGEVGNGVESVNASRVYVGNHLDVLRPLSSRLQDTNLDDMADLVLEYDAVQTRLLREASTYPIDLQYKDSHNKDVLVQNIFNLGPPVGVRQEKQYQFLTLIAGIRHVHPNPFRSSSTISYNLAAESFVSIRVYSIDGRLVKQLISKTMLPGLHEVQWDGRDASGRSLSGGLYLIRMGAGKVNETKKIVLLR